mgnify:CR=1 FL=1
MTSNYALSTENWILSHRTAQKCRTVGIEQSYDHIQVSVGWIYSSKPQRLWQLFFIDDTIARFIVSSETFE